MGREKEKSVFPPLEAPQFRNVGKEAWGLEDLPHKTQHICCRAEACSQAFRMSSSIHAFILKYHYNDSSQKL